MRRPKETRPQTIDPIGVAATTLAAAALFGFGRAWSLLVCIGFALMFLAAEIAPRRRRFAAFSARQAPITGLFLFSVFAIALTASPLAPGGRNPLWSAVSGAGGGAIDLEGHWIGFLQLVGLAAAFSAAASAKPQTAGGALAVIKGTGVLAGLLFGASRLVPALAAAAPLAALDDAGVRGALFGVVLVLSVEEMTRRERRKVAPSRPLFETIGLRLRASPFSLLAFCVSALSFPWSASPSMTVDVTVVVLLFLAWGMLAGGGESRLPRRVLIWLTPAVIGLAAVMAITLAHNFSDTAPVALSRSTHWGAFWASPWSGYGLNTQAEVARLFMTRSNLDALMADPMPPQTFLAWLEQGGLLVAAPLIGCIAWISISIAMSSAGAARADSVKRAAVCVSLYLILLGLTSAAPSTFQIEALWAVMLGIGFSAAHFSR